MRVAALGSGWSVNVYVSSMRRRRDVMVYVRVVVLGWSVDRSVRATGLCAWHRSTRTTQAGPREEGVVVLCAPRVRGRGGAHAASIRYFTSWRVARRVAV